MSSWEVIGPKIVQLGQSELPFHRLAALNSLGEHLEEDQALEIVRKLTSDADQNVRLTANQILKSMEGQPTSRDDLTSPSSQDRERDPVKLTISARQAAEFQLDILGIEPTGPNTAFPVPQANSLEKIIQTVAERQVSPDSADRPKALSSLSVRQVAYYENAMSFLELETFTMTSPESLVSRNELTPADFNRFVNHVLARHSVLRRLTQRLILGLEDVEPEAVELMTTLWISEMGLEPLSKETLTRRTQCIGSWLKWIRDSVLETALDKSTIPPAVNLTNQIGMLDFLVKTGTNTGSSSPAKRKKRPGFSANTSYFPTVLKRLGRVKDSGETTLDRTGQQLGISRERIRQLEKHFSHLGLEAIRNDASEVFRAVEDFTKAPNGISLGEWSLQCAKLAASENAGFDPHRFAEWTTGSFGKQIAADPVETSLLSQYFGPEPPFTFDNPNQNAVLMGTFLLRLTLQKAGFQANTASDFLWIHSHAPTSESKRKSQSELSRLERISRIEAALADGPLRAHEIAQITGEKTAHALREFMRRQPEFDLYKGLWALASSKEFKPGAKQFSSAYEAVIEVLSEHGPMGTNELSAKLADLYPVSWSRINQALDHESIGRFEDGRIGLISQGASKRKEKEPKIPGPLVYSAPVARLSISISKDHLRGSGTGAPRWLGWKLGLTATPQRAVFHSPNGESVEIARRGGAIQLGSIRSLIVEETLKVGCMFELAFDLENFLVVGTHICDEHP